MDDHDSVFRLTHDDFGDLGIPTLSNPQTAIDREKNNLIWVWYFSPKNESVMW
jgi:hypothetical protein